ncbi:uncharacterized protein LOC120356945 isoform X1 [Solenopsis invicta]|uniref:uncharacterized protein LOC120356945 isoform X1 n=1 Tax=Solenopsis invicta TaxID=13686 RepID=UPI00193E7985|nr:uncharacterized protein LOC120356945 isoform X1 [Solenopsis invicta]XP_039301863.1 uncharacterized protein LOC120356945 isoform X1 [Solenopsis invicta]
MASESRGSREKPRNYSNNCAYYGRKLIGCEKKRTYGRICEKEMPRRRVISSLSRLAYFWEKAANHHLRRSFCEGSSFPRKASPLLIMTAGGIDRTNLWKENAVAAAAVTTIAHLTILIELHCCSPTRKGRQSIMAYNPIPSATLSIVQWDNAIVARMP